MRGILILCGRGWCRKAGIRAAAGAWVAGGSAADQRGAKKEAAVAAAAEQRTAPARHRRGGRRVCGAQRGAGGETGRRDAGAQTRSRRGVGTTRRRPKRVGGRVRAVPEGGDTGSGGSVGGQRECGRPEGAKKEAAEAWRGLRKGTAGASGAQERGGRRECGRPEGVGKRKSERGSRKEGRGGGVPAAALNRSIEGPLGGEDGVAEVEGQVHVLPRVDLVLGQRQAHRPDGRVVDQ